MRLRMRLDVSFLPDWPNLWLLASPKYNQLDLPDRTRAGSPEGPCPIPSFCHRSQLGAPELLELGKS
jgi:hypothetical protein